MFSTCHKNSFPRIHHSKHLLGATDGSSEIIKCSSFLNCLQHNPNYHPSWERSNLKNVGKGENANNQCFLLFPQSLLSYPEQILSFGSLLICCLQMLSILIGLLSGDVLIHYCKNTIIYAPTVDFIEKYRDKQNMTLIFDLDLIDGLDLGTKERSNHKEYTLTIQKVMANCLSFLPTNGKSTQMDKQTCQKLYMPRSIDVGA